MKAEKLEKMLAFLTGGASVRPQHAEQAMLLNAALATMCLHRAARAARRREGSAATAGWAARSREGTGSTAINEARCTRQQSEDVRYRRRSTRHNVSIGEGGEVAYRT